MQESSKSLSPVSKTSAFDAKAARKTGQSAGSRTLISSLEAMLGVATIQTALENDPRNLSSAGTLFGNFLSNTALSSDIT